MEADMKEFQQLNNDQGDADEPIEMVQLGDEDDMLSSQEGDEVFGKALPGQEQEKPTELFESFLSPLGKSVQSREG